MTLEGLTKAQVALLRHIFRKTELCEGDIPLKYWCPACHLRLRKIGKLTERYHRQASERKYWSGETETPRYDARA